MSAILRRLGPPDAKAYRALRLEALEDTPEAFGGAYEDEKARSIEDFGVALVRSAMFGVFVSDRLCAMAGFAPLQGRHVEHRGNLFSVYVSPAERGRGIGAMLLAGVLEHAAGSVRQVHLSVGTDNLPAIRLYEGAGFTRYGTEPRSLFVNGRPIDEYLMVRLLDEAPGKKTDNE